MKTLEKVQGTAEGLLGDNMEKVSVFYSKTNFIVKNINLKQSNIHLNMLDL